MFALYIANLAIFFDVLSIDSCHDYDSRLQDSLGWCIRACYHDQSSLDGNCFFLFFDVSDSTRTGNSLVREVTANLELSTNNLLVKQDCDSVLELNNPLDCNYVNCYYYYLNFNISCS